MSTSILSRRSFSAFALAGGLFTLLLLLMMSSPAAAAPPNQTIPTSTSRVAVAHFAPFGDSVDGTAVDVRVDGSTVLSDVVFSDVATGLSLPSGDYLVEIVLPGEDDEDDSDDTVAISGTVSLESGMSYTLIATGDGDNQPLALLPLVDDLQPSSAAKVRVGHLAPFAAALADTAVDICLQSGTVIPGLAGVQYGTVTPDYLELPPDTYDLLIAVAGTNCETVAFDLPAVELAAGDIIDIFAVGKTVGNDDATFPLNVVTLARESMSAGTTLYLPISFNQPSQDGGEQPEEPSTITEIVVANDDFSTLEQAVVAANLVDTLNGEGPFTVFAPNNAAFVSLPDGTLEAALADPDGLLTDILLYHVISSTVNAADITDGLTATTVQGQELTFSIGDDGVQVNGINIIQTDIAASNGVIHVIDGVLIPESEED